jgi:hypothetical protein
VIEGHPFRPTRRVVALSAELALLPAMYVVSRVTSTAISRELFLTRAASMAARAGGEPVCAGQSEARIALMIE